ncbi:Type I restriction-modification system, restriction subunit R [Methanosarcina sp. MTP4]|uniref:type I restriction endonuclease subunit R n=1 Tax=Methanosarcina sp. MTP4 TaxID=1434100 RepID=UPI0006156515|nr:DEAD/DEAH box helicase family protein [Methanosarcina sp. MTP4]AKB24774.1 Type I restriction-modification system, restriction subunit R [Methanosarcina sp. MTP4]
MDDLNEFQTRKQKIDVLLQEQGWDVNDRSKIVLEVDTKQSDFAKQDYKRVNETRRNDSESKYADYLLLDSTGKPLAIIEAKRTTKDPLLGQKQAEEYADDIKAQTGEDVFIFLSNGYEIWLWDRERYGLRLIKGFYTQKDLERLLYQRKNSELEAEIDIDGSIVDRPKSIEVATRIVEQIHKGHRKALIVMATGTGKTRVAMAIIDQLIREGRVQRVLFLTDRKALRKQAYDKGYLRFFPEETKDIILSGNYKSSCRLYVSTIQTFQEIYNQKDRNGRYRISPGSFDLIFSDEAHRSIYSKWKGIFTYLDAIQIGLTATPADMVDRDTFRFFECHDDIPTALYSYEDAVRDGVLCDFRKNISGARTYFQVEGIKPADLTEGEREELIKKGIDPDEIDFEGTELEKKVAVKGTSEAIVREFMENCITDRSGTLPAKTIFFAISKLHARRLWEAFEKLYPEYKGTLARIIVSEDSRAQHLIDDFKEKPFPRVAISVDMMDTGIDVPEVCNLVFAKPVFSKIKFWQMLGRGTRADGACEHRDWLPDGKKEYFKVFDFWNNFEYWDMNPEGVKNESPDAITSRIFLTRLKQLDELMQRGDPESKRTAEEVKEKILGDIRALPMDSVSVREQLQDVEKALSPKLWDNIAVDPIDFLQKKITPLMKYRPGVDLKEATFTLRCERLAYALLQNDRNEIERLKKPIAEMVDRLPRTLDKVREKEALLDRVLSRSFWETVSFEDVQALLSEIAPLMPYMAKEPRETIVIDMGDHIAERKEWEIFEGKEPEYVESYKEEVEAWIQNLAETHPVVQRIINDETLTESDLQLLEETLQNSALSLNESKLNQLYRHRETPLVEFIRLILNLYSSPSPEEKIKDAFQTYIIESNKQYSADQLNFIRTLQTVFLQKKHIDFHTLWNPPFTNFGINAPMPMFSQEEINAFIDICNGVEKEIFA